MSVEIDKKISITKPRRSATYSAKAPSESEYRVSINKTGTALTVRGRRYGSANSISIPHDDVPTVIELLQEAVLERNEQTSLEEGASK